MGFNGGPGCGNAYFGKHGREYSRQIDRESAEATGLGGEIVMANMPNLKSFTIGGLKPDITRTEEGTIILTWPWTGRMDEWLMEMTPEPRLGGRDPFDDDY